MKRRHWWRIVALVAGLAFVAVAGIASPDAHAAEGPGDGPMFQGIVKAVDETVLSAEMSGRLDAVPYDEGEVFKKGDLLVAFDCDILQAEADAARASVAAAEAQLENTRRLDRIGTAGALDLVLARAARDEKKAEMRVAAARARLCRITAPFDGRVLAREVEPYESVRVMSPLLTIARKGTLDVVIIAPAALLGHLGPGTGFSFTAKAGGPPVAGSVSKMGAVVDPASQTVRIEGRLEQAHGILFPGMSGRVRFDGQAARGQAE